MNYTIYDCVNNCFKRYLFLKTFPYFIYLKIVFGLQEKYFSSSFRRTKNFKYSLILYRN